MRRIIFLILIIPLLGWSNWQDNYQPPRTESYKFNFDNVPAYMPKDLPQVLSHYDFNFEFKPETKSFVCDFVKPINLEVHTLSFNVKENTKITISYNKDENNWMWKSTKPVEVTGFGGMARMRFTEMKVDCSINLNNFKVISGNFKDVSGAMGGLSWFFKNINYNGNLW